MILGPIVNVKRPACSIPVLLHVSNPVLFPLKGLSDRRGASALGASLPALCLCPLRGRGRRGTDRRYGTPFNRDRPSDNGCEARRRT